MVARVAAQGAGRMRSKRRIEGLSHANSRLESGIERSGHKNEISPSSFNFLRALSKAGGESTMNKLRKPGPGELRNREGDHRSEIPGNHHEPEFDAMRKHIEATNERIAKWRQNVRPETGDGRDSSETGSAKPEISGIRGNDEVSSLHDSDVLSLHDSDVSSLSDTAGIRGNDETAGNRGRDETASLSDTESTRDSSVFSETGSVKTEASSYGSSSDTSSNRGNDETAEGKRRFTAKSYLKAVDGKLKKDEKTAKENEEALRKNLRTLRKWIYKLPGADPLYYEDKAKYKENHKEMKKMMISQALENAAQGGQNAVGGLAPNPRDS